MSTALEHLIDYLAMRGSLEDGKGRDMEKFDYRFLQTTLVLLVIMIIMMAFGIGAMVMFTSLV